jgi:hypothetical protein
VGFFYLSSHHMHYTTEQLDRSTGELHLASLGEWITLTELGKQYGVGERKIRTILHHLGMLQPEGGRYRLTARAIEQGFGKRHDNPKKHQYPFDVISPLGQQIIAENWDWVVTDLEQKKRSTPRLRAASDALEEFKKARSSQLTTQMDVCWLTDHFPKLTPCEIAQIVGVPHPQVYRYSRIRSKQRDFWHRLQQREGLPSSPVDVILPSAQSNEINAYLAEECLKKTTRERSEGFLHSLSMYGLGGGSNDEGAQENNNHQ